MPIWKHETINTLVHIRFISKNKSTGKLFTPTGHWSFLGLKHLKPSNVWSTSNGICWIYAEVILHHIPTSTVAPVLFEGNILWQLLLEKPLETVGPPPRKNQLSGRWVAWSIPPPNCGLCTALRWGLPRYRRCFSRRLGEHKLQITTGYYTYIYIVYIYIHTTGYWSFVDLSVVRLFYDSATEHRSSAISKKIQVMCNQKLNMPILLLTSTSSTHISHNSSSLSSPLNLLSFHPLKTPQTLPHIPDSVPRRWRIGVKETADTSMAIPKIASLTPLVSETKAPKSHGLPFEKDTNPKIIFLLVRFTLGMREWSIITSNNHPNNPQQPIHSPLSTSKSWCIFYLWTNSCEIPFSKLDLETQSGFTPWETDVQIGYLLIYMNLL